MYKKFKRGHMTEVEYYEALMRSDETALKNNADDQMQRSCKGRNHRRNTDASFSRKNFRKKKLL